MPGFLGVPVDAAYHLVFALTHLLTPVAGGLAAAAAIVLFTAAVRLLISPLSFRALRGQAALARLAPQVQALRSALRRPSRSASAASCPPCTRRKAPAPSPASSRCWPSGRS